MGTEAGTMYQSVAGSHAAFNSTKPKTDGNEVVELGFIDTFFNPMIPPTISGITSYFSISNMAFLKEPLVL